MNAVRRVTWDSVASFLRNGWCMVELACPKCDCKRMEIEDDQHYRCCDCGMVFKWGGRE